MELLFWFCWRFFVAHVLGGYVVVCAHFFLSWVRAKETPALCRHFFFQMDFCRLCCYSVNYVVPKVVGYACFDFVYQFEWIQKRKTLYIHFIYIDMVTSYRLRFLCVELTLLLCFFIFIYFFFVCRIGAQKKWYEEKRKFNVVVKMVRFLLVYIQCVFLFCWRLNEKRTRCMIRWFLYIILCECVFVCVRELLLRCCLLSISLKWENCMTLFFLSSFLHLAFVGVYLFKWNLQVLVCIVPWWLFIEPNEPKGGKHIKKDNETSINMLNWRHHYWRHWFRWPMHPFHFSIFFRFFAISMMLTQTDEENQRRNFIDRIALIKMSATCTEWSRKKTHTTDTEKW